MEANGRDLATHLNNLAVYREINRRHLRHPHLSLRQIIVGMKDREPWATRMLDQQPNSYQTGYYRWLKRKRKVALSNAQS